MKLIVTRPLPGADATVARVVAAGHEAIAMPLFALHPVAWDAPDRGDFDGLLITSSNAVRLARAGLHQFADLPVYAVGQATAHTAKIAGLNVAVIGEGGGQDILAAAKESGSRHLLWLAGQDRIALVPAEGLTVEAVTVYQSEALPAPQDFKRLLGDADAVLLHSARAAAHFAWLCDTNAVDRRGIFLAAFSSAIAEAAGDGWHSLTISPLPSDAALLAQLASDFTAPPAHS